MSVSIITAMTDERVIGKDNGLPWKLSADMKRFKNTTMGHPVIMGRKTYDSMGRPLPGRRNIVVTRNKALQIPGVEVVFSLEEAIGLCSSEEENFVVGGAELYREALPLADRLYLTLIHHPFPGDTFFPSFDLETDFKVVDRSNYRKEGEDGFSYTFLQADRSV